MVAPARGGNVRRTKGAPPRCKTTVIPAKAGIQRGRATGPRQNRLICRSSTPVAQSSPSGEDQEWVQRSDGVNVADHQLSISQSSKMTARVSPNTNNRPRKALANSPFTVTSSPMSTDAILRLVVKLHSTYRSSANVNGGST